MRARPLWLGLVLALLVVAARADEEAHDYRDMGVRVGGTKLEFVRQEHAQSHIYTAQRLTPTGGMAVRIEFRMNRAVNPAQAHPESFRQALEIGKFLTDYKMEHYSVGRRHTVILEGRNREVFLAIKSVLLAEEDRVVAWTGISDNIEEARRLRDEIEQQIVFLPCKRVIGGEPSHCAP